MEQIKHLFRISASKRKLITYFVRKGSIPISVLKILSHNNFVDIAFIAHKLEYIRKC